MSGLLTEHEVAQVSYSKKLSEKNFLDRSEYFLRNKEEKMHILAIEAANRPDN